MTWFPEKPEEDKLCVWCVCPEVQPQSLGCGSGFLLHVDSHKLPTGKRNNGRRKRTTSAAQHTFEQSRVEIGNHFLRRCCCVFHVRVCPLQMSINWQTLELWPNTWDDSRSQRHWHARKSRTLQRKNLPCDESPGSKTPATPSPLPALDDQELWVRAHGKIIGAPAEYFHGFLHDLWHQTRIRIASCMNFTNAHDLWHWEGHNLLHSDTHKLNHPHIFTMICATGIPRSVLRRN